MKMGNEKRIIIGIVGHPSCGKDTVAEYLVKKHGFTFVSTSDLIRDYIRERELGEPTRELMHDVVNEWRRREGGDVLINIGMKKTQTAQRIAMGGIRAIGEAGAIKKAGGIIIAVTAPIKIRFARAKSRSRIGDNVTFEQFKATEDAEASNNDPETQNVNAVIAAADHTINNSGTIDHLQNQIDEVIQKISSVTHDNPWH
jgi:dephospho-CoA kinase